MAGKAAFQEIWLDLEELPAPLDWRAVFGREAPVELEIGFGKGRSLLAQAAAHSERNYLGVEIARQYLRLAQRRAERRGLANVRVVADDAGDFLRARVPPASLEAVYAYCPDPWPKKRHHKRRLFTFGFIVDVARALIPGGTFLFASDHQAYFDLVTSFVEAAAEFERPEITMRRPADGVDAARTNYERKWLSLGRPVFTLLARRVSR